MTDPVNPAREPVVITKDRSGRLRDRDNKTDVTLEDLARLVRDGTSFVVRDAKSGDDVTCAALAAVIIDADSRAGPPMLPVSFMRDLIGYYGSGLQVLLPLYLDYSMQVFVENQENLRAYMEDAFSGTNPAASLEAIGRRNMALFERTMKALPELYAAARNPEEASKIADLRVQIASVRAQLGARGASLSAG